MSAYSCVTLLFRSLTVSPPVQPARLSALLTGLVASLSVCAFPLPRLEAPWASLVCGHNLSVVRIPSASTHTHTRSPYGFLILTNVAFPGNWRCLFVALGISRCIIALKLKVSALAFVSAQVHNIFFTYSLATTVVHPPCGIQTLSKRF